MNPFSIKTEFKSFLIVPHGHVLANKSRIHVGGAISNMLMFKMQKEAAGMGMLGNDNNPPSHAQETWQGAE